VEVCADVCAAPSHHLQEFVASQQLEDFVASQQLEVIVQHACKQLVDNIRGCIVKVQQLLEVPAEYEDVKMIGYANCGESFPDLEGQEDEFNVDLRHPCLSVLKAFFLFQYAVSELVNEPSVDYIYVPSCEEDLDGCRLIANGVRLLACLAYVDMKKTCVCRHIMRMQL